MVNIRWLKDFLLALFTNLFFIAPAFAGSNFGPVQPGSATGLAQTIYDLVSTLGMPIGGSIIFGCVVIMAVKIAASGLQGRAEKKAEAMGGLGYVLFGGILLGASLFIAGAIIGIGQQAK